MSRFAVFCLALGAAAGVSMTAGHARQIDVWGHKFDVDNGPVVGEPSTGFKALAAHPERDRDTERLPDTDILR